MSLKRNAATQRPQQPFPRARKQTMSGSALQIDKKFGEAYLQLADVYAAEAQPLKAYEQLVRAGELLPGRPEVVDQLRSPPYNCASD
jgi:Tfp pilus assembly protein PilF